MPGQIARGEPSPIPAPAGAAVTRQQTVDYNADKAAYSRDLVDLRAGRNINDDLSNLGNTYLLVDRLDRLLRRNLTDDHLLDLAVTWSVKLNIARNVHEGERKSVREMHDDVVHKDRESIGELAMRLELLEDALVGLGRPTDADERKHTRSLDSFADNEDYMPVANGLRMSNQTCDESVASMNAHQTSLTRTAKRQGEVVPDERDNEILSLKVQIVKLTEPTARA